MNSAASPSSTSLAVRLRAFLVAHFSRNELELLCLDLHVDPEDVPGMDKGKEYWAAQIVRYFERRDALPELIRRCRELRPDVPWDELDAALPADEAAAHSLPRLAILYAEPLAYRRDGAAEAEPIDRLDFAAERKRLCEVFDEARRAVVVEFAPCNADEFRRVVTLGCRALHYSGHGHPDFLAFEDDEAGLNPIMVERLRELLSAGGEPAIRFAFVSACHSRRAGEAFVEAGVPHVVAVRVETAVLDVAAREFARHFYLALLAGRTVQQAFEIGRAYVAALPDVRADADKFVLLPAGADHERTVFDDAPAGRWRDATPPLPPGNLPAPPERLIGRNATLQQVIAEVLRSRLVTLRGAPGIGKSSLAVAAAHYLRERRRFRDGVLFISLRNAVSTEQLRADMASALGLAEIKDDRQLFAALREQRCLFVLDNAEDALNAAFAPQFRRFVRDLLTSCAGVRLLVTSRQALGGGLPGVAERVIKPPPLDPRSAAQLLLALVPDPDRLIAELSAGGITTLDALARHPMLKALAGNPFAISLAAPLLGDKTLAEVSALIEARPVEALAVQGVPEDERDETMSVARSLGASFDALHKRNPPAARLFGVMGLLPGGALAADLQAIWGEGWPALMDELVGRSLIEREPSAFGPHRIAFPFVAAFAESRLSAEDRRGFALRVADHMAQLSMAIYEQVGREGARDAYALFQLHEDNLRACLRTTRPAREKRADETASPVGVIAAYLPQILLRAYRLDDAISAARDGLAACRAVGDRLGEANVLQAIGDVQQFRDDRDAALESYAKALDLFKAVGDRLGEANVLKAIGDVQQFRKETNAALESYAKALDLFKAVGAKLGEANVLKAIGDVQQFRDDRDAALESYAKALDLFKAVGDRLGEANVLKAIGDVQQFRKETNAALESYAKALDLFKAVGDRLGEANVLKAIGDVQQFRKETNAALESYAKALDLFKAVGAKLGEANVLKAIGDVQQFRDDRDAALESYAKALDLFKAVGDRLGEANVLKAIGDVQQFRKETNAALESYAKALDLFKAVGDRLGEANVLKAIGDVQQFRDDRDAALESYAKALDLFKAVGAKLGEANVLQAIGDVQQFRKETNAALESYAKALDLFKAVGAKLGEANVLQAIGDVQQFRDDRDAALESYAKALDLFKAVGAKLGEANVLKAIGDVQQFRKETNAALESYAKALDLFKAVGDRLGEANVLKAIGDVQQFRDDRDAALESYAKALDLFKAVGDRLGEANVLQAIGDVQQFRKETNAALESYAKALDLFKAVGDRLGEANVLQAIGDVQQFRDDRDAALESYAKALDLFKAVGAKLGEANVYLAIGRLQGEPELFEQAIAIYRAIGDAYSTARGLYFYGLWLLDANQLERAVESLSEARQIWAQMGFAQGVQVAEQALARAWPQWSQMIPSSVQGPLAAFAAALQAAQADERDVALWQAAVEAGEVLLAALEAEPPVPGLSVADMRAELASAWNTLGNAQDEAGDTSAALAAFERAIALQPDFAMWHRNRAGVLIELGRLDEAAAAIETARRLEPDAPRLRELDEQLAAARAAAGKAC